MEGYDKKHIYKRTLITVIFSQIFGGAGLAAGITVGAILAEEMLKSDALSGLPSTLFTIGSALAAFTVGKLSNKFGRRIGLTIGFLIGGLGALGVIAAYSMHNIFLLLIFLFLYGAGGSTNLQSRYAGTDLAESHQRGRAVSIAMIFTTVGVLAAPNLVGISKAMTDALHINHNLGPFLLAGISFSMAALIIFIFMRPDPFLLARHFENSQEDNHDYHVQQDDKKGITIGALTMVTAQIIMVGIMTMTPLYMKHHHHEITAIGTVIGFHIASMYLPSLVTGTMVDKLGTKMMAVLSAVILLSAGLVTATAPPESTVMMIIGLSLLGLGWNFGFISGTTMLVNSTNPLTRAQTQGSIDVFIALSGAAASVLSGVMMAWSGYSILSIVGGVLSLVMIPLVIYQPGRSK